MAPYPEMICKCIKSDISFDLEKGPFTKVMYKMKCMDPLHASLTDNLSDPKETSKMLVVCLYVLRGRLLGRGWPLGSRLWCLL